MYRSPKALKEMGLREYRVRNSCAPELGRPVAFMLSMFLRRMIGRALMGVSKATAMPGAVPSELTALSPSKVASTIVTASESSPVSKALAPLIGFDADALDHGELELFDVEAVIAVDAVEVLVIARAEQVDGLAEVVHPGCPADAVDILLAFLGDIIIVDVRHALDV